MAMNYFMQKPFCTDVNKSLTSNSLTNYLSRRKPRMFLEFKVSYVLFLLFCMKCVVIISLSCTWCYGSGEHG